MHDQDNFLLVFILHVRWETHVQKIWSQSNHKHIIPLFNSFVVDFFDVLCKFSCFQLASLAICYQKSFSWCPCAALFVLFFTSKLKHMGPNSSWQNFLITLWLCVNIHPENDKQACFDRFVISNFSACRYSSESAATLNTWHVKLWPIFLLREIWKDSFRRFFLNKDFLSLCYFTSYLM